METWQPRNPTSEERAKLFLMNPTSLVRNSDHRDRINGIQKYSLRKTEEIVRNYPKWEKWESGTLRTRLTRLIEADLMFRFILDDDIFTIKEKHGKKLPLRKLAISGPPQIGKTSLAVSLREIIGQSVDFCHLDVFSFGDEHAARGTSGWAKGGRKRLPVSLETKSKYLNRLSEARRGRSWGDVMTVSDTPGNKMPFGHELFADFYETFDGVVSLGNSEAEIMEWAGFYLGHGARLEAKVITVPPDKYDAVYWNQGEKGFVTLPRLERGIESLNPGVIGIGEKLVELVFREMMREGIFPGEPGYAWRVNPYRA